MTKQILIFIALRLIPLVGMSICSQRVGYPWYYVLSRGMVYPEGVEYTRDRTYRGGGLRYIPPGVEATAAVSTHPAAILSCYCLQTKYREGNCICLSRGGVGVMVGRWV